MSTSRFYKERISKEAWEKFKSLENELKKNPSKFSELIEDLLTSSGGVEIINEPSSPIDLAVKMKRVLDDIETSKVEEFQSAIRNHIEQANLATTHKARQLFNVRLMAQLYKAYILSLEFVIPYLNSLLANGDDESYEFLYAFLFATSSKVESDLKELHKNNSASLQIPHNFLETVFTTITSASVDNKLSFEVRLSLLDLVLFQESGWKPRNVAGVVIFRETSDNNYEYLLLHATNIRRHWSIPKGSTDPGETDFEAAKRETKEEAALDWPLDYELIPGFCRTYDYPKHGRMSRIACWAGRIKDPARKIQLSHEHDEFVWIDRATLQNAEHFRPFIKNACADVDDFLKNQKNR